LSNPQIGRNYATGSVHDADKRDAIYFGRWDGTGRDFLGIKCRVDTHTALGYGDYSNQTKLEFYTWGNNYASSREVMCIRGDGNVGIGTASPSYKLDVAGTSNAATYYQNGVELYAQRRWEVDLTGQSTSNFYPVELKHPKYEGSPDLPDMFPVHFKVFGESLGGGSPYNESTLVGYARGGGWSDHKHMYDVHYKRYDGSEKRFEGLYRGTQDYGGGIVIYMRGGYRYSVLTDATEVNTYTSAQTLDNAVFAIKNVSGADVSGTSTAIGRIVHIAGTNEGEKRFMSGNLQFDGNVGIGTTEPYSKLDTRGDTIVNSGEANWDTGMKSLLGTQDLIDAGIIYTGSISASTDVDLPPEVVNDVIAKFVNSHTGEVYTGQPSTGYTLSTGDVVVFDVWIYNSSGSTINSQFFIFGGATQSVAFNIPSNSTWTKYTQTITASAAGGFSLRMDNNSSGKTFYFTGLSVRVNPSNTTNAPFTPKGFPLLGTGTVLSVPNIVAKEASIPTLLGNVVGIGTTSPAAKLHIETSSTSSGSVMRVDASSVTNTGYSEIQMVGPGQTSQGLSMFCNGSGRTSDGGASATTVRNNNGPIILGNSSYVNRIRKPKDDDFICGKWTTTLDASAATTVITNLRSCVSTPSAGGTNMSGNIGRFTAPEDGYYFACCQVDNAARNNSNLLIIYQAGGTNFATNNPNIGTYSEIIDLRSADNVEETYNKVFVMHMEQNNYIQFRVHSSGYTESSSRKMQCYAYLLNRI
jgi:hypothetical protein